MNLSVQTIKIKEGLIMKRMKRILCLAGVIFLLGLYLVTLISAFFTTKATAGLFKACVFSTIIIPILLYGYILIYRVLKNNNSHKEEKEADD